MATVQDYYRRGRNIREVRASDVEGLCQCGYLTLAPTTETENYNGGLTVKRKNVTILRDDGSVVKRWRGHRYYACNACGNNWR